jgi:effector-binding domain-containing protein
MDVEQRTYPSIRMAFRTFSGPIEGLAQAVRALVHDVHATGEPPLGPPIVLYPSAGQDPSAVVTRVCVPIGPDFQGYGDVRTLTMESVEVAVARHDGPWAEIGRAYEALSTWVDEHGRTMAEGASETFLVGPQTDAAPAEWRTEVAVRLKSL